MTVRRAECSCGQLSATCAGEPVRNSVCHCLACQRRTGSAFGQQARFLAANVTIEGRSTSFARTGDEGGVATFHFCPVCGATVYYDFADMPEYVAVPVGAFADPAFPAPTVSVYEERKQAWVCVPDDLVHER